MIITIDGPVASGKSTAAQRLAQALDYYYLNSGMLYRAFAFALINSDVTSYENLSEKEIDRHLSRVDYHYEPTLNELSVFVDGNNVITVLKSAEVDHAASKIGVQRLVRQSITEFQRQLASMRKNIVAEGRDAGTIVFPNADFKLFLTASLPVRAKRWRLDQEKKDLHYTQEEAEKIIDERDHRDSTRKESPLIIDPEAIEIDTTDFDAQETLKVLLGVVRP